MKKSAGSIIVLLLIVVALFALNPTKDDFASFKERQAREAVGGTLGRLAGGVASIASGVYDRDNLGVLSVFYVKVNGKKTGQYLGIAKMFIKLGE